MLLRCKKRKCDSAVEISIYIHEKHRGRGVGRRRMEETPHFAERCEDIGTVISLNLNVNAYQMIYDREKWKDSREM